MLVNIIPTFFFHLPMFAFVIDNTMLYCVIVLLVGVTRLVLVSTCYVVHWSFYANSSRLLYYKILSTEREHWLWKNHGQNPRNNTSNKEDFVVVVTVIEMDSQPASQLVTTRQLTKRYAIFRQTTNKSPVR